MQRHDHENRASPATDSTAELVSRLREGDTAARDRLIERMLPILQRWAHGRLPGYARGMVDTDDLVQICLIRTVDRLAELEIDREGALLAYLRRALMNAIRDEIRRSVRRPARDPLGPAHFDPRPSPVERAVGTETLERYEEALGELTARQREAVIMRLEMDLPYAEIAAAIGSPSADAARMTVARATVRLARTMADGEPQARSPSRKGDPE